MTCAGLDANPVLEHDCKSVRAKGLTGEHQHSLTDAAPRLPVLPVQHQLGQALSPGLGTLRPGIQPQR